MGDLKEEIRAMKYKPGKRDGVRWSTKVKHPSKDELFQLVVIEEKTDEEIAALYGASEHTVYNWIRKANLSEYAHIPESMIEIAREGKPSI